MFRNVRRAVSLACLSLSLAGPALAKTTSLPAYLPLAPGLAPPEPDNVSYETYGVAEFYPDPSVSESTVRRGKHWHADLALGGVPDDTEGRDVWARIKPTLLQAGWVVTAEYDSNPFSANLHYQRGNVDSWMYVKIFGVGDLRSDIVEIGPPPFTHTLASPAATPERVNPGGGDFPWLAPLPGSKLDSSAPDSGAMEVTLPGADEPEIVATGTITKHYIGPEGLSTLLFVTAYHDALLRAGWTIIYETQGLHQSDAVITAHYDRNGRNIWAYMHSNFGIYSMKVADAGARDLGAELARSCHVALDGVLFDFNKATLKPESDPVLERARALLAKEAALRVEIQGHTDGVGGDAYNVTLSEARARAVAAWLAARGIAAERLASKGYGKAVPIADNDSPEGRARNPRVEVSKPACKPR